MKTIKEYIQKKHITTKLKMEIIDGIHCFNVGEHNGKTIYVSLPSVNKEKLETDPDGTPITTKYSYKGFPTKNGWKIPSRKDIENILEPLFNKLSDFDAEQIFGKCAEHKAFTFYGIFLCSDNSFELRTYFYYVGHDDSRPGLHIGQTINSDIKYYIVAIKEI